MEKNKDGVLIFITVILAAAFLLGVIRNTSITKKYEKQSDIADSLQEEVWENEDEVYDYQDEIDRLEAMNESLGNENNELFESMVAMGVDYEFFWEYAACVNSNGSYYHHPSCEKFSDDYFYIYNTDLAESYGYKPCPDCW